VQAWKRHHKYECKGLAESIKDEGLSKDFAQQASLRMLLQLLVMKRNGLINDEDWNAVLELKHHELLLTDDDDLEEPGSTKSSTSSMNDTFMQIKLEEMHSKVALSIAGMPASARDIKNAVSLQNKVRP
jgi:hypothetical protein